MPEPVLRASEYMRTPQVDMLLLGRGEQMRELAGHLIRCLLGRLLVAGMSIMASGHDGRPLDYTELERWTRIGYERGMRSRKGER
jgi:hypothetical protein